MTGAVPGDALISLQYTKRLLAGNGLTWTAGMPVEGYSNFLWVQVCAVPAYFFNGNSHTVAELDASLGFGIRVEPDRPAYLPLDGLPVSRVERVEVHPPSILITADLVEVEGGELALRLRSSEPAGLDSVSLGW